MRADPRLAPLEATPCTGRHDATPRAPRRRVVAVLVVCGDRVLLARRSPLVASDQGMWHCITGFLDADLDPREQALQELQEELGLDPSSIDLITEGPPTTIGPADASWTVHPFLVSTRQRHVRLNWENDAATWVRRDRLPRRCVPWLLTVGDALGYPCRRLQPEAPFGVSLTAG